MSFLGNLRGRLPSGMRWRVASRWWPVILASLCAPVLSILVVPGFSALFTKNDTWTNEAKREIGGSVTQELFHKALKYDIINFDLKTYHFDIVTKREWNTQKRKSGVKDNDGYNAKTALELIWRTRGSGKEIRDQITVYNETALFAGIRDNSGKLKSCSIDANNDDLCKTNLWKASVQLANTNNANGFLVQNSSEFGIEQLAGPNPPVGIFGTLAIDQLPDFRNWYSIVGTELRATVLGFVRPGNTNATVSGDLVLDIIGTELILPAAALSAAKVTTYCWPKFQGKPKLTIERCNNNSQYVASRVELPGSFATRDIAISIMPIKLFGVPLFERNAEFLKNIRVAPNGSSKIAKYELTNNMRLQCYSHGLGKRFCGARWLGASSRVFLIPQTSVGGETFISEENPEEDQDKKAPSDALISSNGEGLLTISDRGRELGLAAVLGQTSRDRNSMLRLLSSPPEGLEANRMDVEIIPDIQQIVAKHFSALLQKGEGIGNLGKNVTRTFASKRRAGVVILDLREENRQGAIVAAVGYPFYDGSLSEWDLLAIQKLDASHDPLAPHVWGAIDSRYTPGSTFKLLTALSLIDASIGELEGVAPNTRAAIFRAIKGETPKFYKSIVNDSLKTKVSNIPKTNLLSDGKFKLTDAGGVIPFINAFKLPSRTCGRAASNKKNKPQSVKIFGLCEAIAQSSNKWFARMALLANKTSLDNFWDEAPLEDRLPVMVPTLQKLALDKPFVLIKTENNINRFQFPAYTLADPVLAGSITNAINGKGPGRLANLTIGLNGYGQDVTASPLAIATISASIATGKRIKPFLVRDLQSNRVNRPLYQDSSQAGELLNILREGMHAVVNKPGGTAFSFFRKAKNISPRVFGKTGTPILKGHGIPQRATVYGSWFTGWIGKNNKASNPRPKFAFACGISHTVRSGSPVCASLMANILADMEASGF